MKTALITGITGQDGSYLSQFLLEKGYNVIGVSRDTTSLDFRNLLYLDIAKDVEVIQANLNDLSNIIRIISKYKPDEIYHLAAQSSVGLSFEQPIGTLSFNILSTANILEAIRIVNPAIRFYNASSSEMYGNLKRDDLPVTEGTVLHPVSPYSISKASAHWITINYREAYDIYSVCGILFNHESCLRGNNFVTKKIIGNAIRINNGDDLKLHLGNLNIYRDWGYAPEYVKAMWLMLQQDTPDDFIICSGSYNSLEYFTKKVLGVFGLDFDKVVTIDRSLFRPLDLEIIYGDNSKAKQKLGWNYNFTFDEFIERLCEDELKLHEWENTKFQTELN